MQGARVRSQEGELRSHMRGVGVGQNKLKKDIVLFRNLGSEPKVCVSPELGGELRAVSSETLGKNPLYLFDICIEFNRMVKIK